MLGIMHARILARGYVARYARNVFVCASACVNDDVTATRRQAHPADSNIIAGDLSCDSYILMTRKDLGRHVLRLSASH